MFFSSRQCYILLKQDVFHNLFCCLINNNLKMSVFDGEIDFRTVYMTDYVPKKLSKAKLQKTPEDNCLIVGIRRDALSTKDPPPKTPDVICPLQLEHYKKAVARFSEEHPKITKKFMSEDVDPIAIKNENQDLNRTEYLTKYCSRELPFVSINLARRAKALQTIYLPDDVIIPDTTYGRSFRRPPDRYMDKQANMSMKPVPDDSLNKQLVKILRIRTGDSTYGACHGLLGKVVLEKNPFGTPREEPAYGRWSDPYYYTYPI